MARVEGHGGFANARLIRRGRRNNGRQPLLWPTMRGKLPTQLWREIYKSAVYLYNRTPKYSHKWESPYEKLTGKPAQQHLRAYGCKAFAMTTTAQEKKQRLGKLDPRAWI
ncbi:hypothetical protein G6O67_006295 [Ophiocordyceps sinensis]|uniref:Uncharacterized protein n=1 Tax=Ophiocordyceps sinensis TaxID=72228 RepID=A0A8H4LV85_9HYPO|nr:hypothetical protein G6O67_006295 [Ophiocordyceps sinensis]